MNDQPKLAVDRNQLVLGSPVIIDMDTGNIALSRTPTNGNVVVYKKKGRKLPLVPIPPLTAKEEELLNKNNK